MYQNADFIERSLISGPIVFTVVGFILGPDRVACCASITGEGLRLLAELTSPWFCSLTRPTQILVSSGAIWASRSEFWTSVYR